MDPFIIFTGTLESPLSFQNVYVLSSFVKDIILNLKLNKTFSVWISKIYILGHNGNNVQEEKLTTS